LHSIDGHLAVEPRVGGEKHRPHASLTERALDLVASLEIDDLDVIDDGVESGCVTPAERPLVAEAHVGPQRPGRLPGKRRLATEAVVFFRCHDYSPQFTLKTTSHSEHR
jgi:hypothetical protein